MVVDILSVVLLVWFLIRGYRKGMIRSLRYLISWVIAIGVAMYFWIDTQNPLIRLLSEYLRNPAALQRSVVLFLLTLTGIRVLVGVILSWISRRVNRVPVLGHANRFAGAALGGVKALLLVWLMAFVLIQLGAMETSSQLYPVVKGSQILGILQGSY